MYWENLCEQLMTIQGWGGGGQPPPHTVGLPDICDVCPQLWNHLVAWEPLPCEKGSGRTVVLLVDVTSEIGRNLQPAPAEIVSISNLEKNS